MLPVSGSQETLQLFLALVHKDARVEVGAWRAEGAAAGGGSRLRRTVTYRAPMRGPAWFRALCGARPAPPAGDGGARALRCAASRGGTGDDPAPVMALATGIV